MNKNSENPLKFGLGFQNMLMKTIEKGIIFRIRTRGLSSNWASLFVVCSLIL